MKITKLLLFVVAALMAFVVCSPATHAQQKSILFTDYVYGQPRFLVDPEYQKKLEADGWNVGYTSLQKLDWDILAQFNVLVLQEHPHALVPNYKSIADEKRALIQKFLDAGGGVLVFADMGQTPIYPYLNEFLQPFGIAIIPDVVMEKDPAKQKHLTNYYAQIAHSTTNIAASPITEGVKEIWYPKHSTVTLNADADWKIAVRASDTAYSEQTPDNPASTKGYPSAPPIIACRTIDNGRMVVFSTHSSFYTLNPYHFMWDKGFFLNNGDGYTLMSNINSWLGEPSITSGKLGGFTERQQKQLYDLSPYLKESIVKTDSWTIGGTPRKTLIGVRSTYSGGKYTVKQFADAAKKLGIEMLVFTEDANLMDRDAWQKLSNDCKAVSSETFLALPGVHFRGLETGNKGAAFNLKIPWYDIPFRDKAFHTYIRIGVNTGWSSNVATVFPSSNPMSIYNMGAITGHTLFSYNGAKLVDTDIKTFLKTSGEGWGLFPMTYASIDDPSQMASLNDAYFTYFYLNRLGSDYDPNKNSLLTSFVSNGPIIDYLKFEAPGSWVQVKDRPVTFSFKVHSDAPLKKVVAMANGKVIRTFYPNTETFEKSFVYRTNQNLQFYIVATDANGRTAYSRTLNNGRVTYSYFIGTDRMNGYWYPVTPAKPERAYGKFQGRFGRIGWEIFPGFGWGDQIPVRTGPQQNSHPLGPETGQPTGGLSGIELIPLIYMNGTAEFNPSAPYRRVSLNSTDCIILRDTIDNVTKHQKDEAGRSLSSVVPTKYLRGDVVGTVFRCPDTFLMTIEANLEAKQDFDIDPSKPNYMFLIPYSGLADTYSSIVSKNGSAPVKTVDFTAPVDYRLDGNSYIGVVDNPYGVGGLFTFDPTDVSIQQSGQFPRLYAMPHLGSMHVKRGQKLHSKYLLVLTQGEGVNSAEVFNDVYDKYGFDGTPASQITAKTGKLITYVFTPEFIADDYGVRAAFSKADLPAGLGIKVHRCNPNWDVSVYDVAKKELLRNVTMDEGAAYVNLDVSRAREVFIGNLIRSDNEALFINVYEAAPDTLYVTVHNPTDASVTANLTNAPDLDLPEVHQSITLAPGQSKDLAFVGSTQ